MRALALLFVAAYATVATAQKCDELTVEQRTYARIESLPGNPWVFLYVPDIKSAVFGGGFSSLQLFLVEGVYGPPFPQRQGRVSDSTFNQLRQSLNVKLVPINVAYDRRTGSSAAVSQAVSVGAERLRVEIPAGAVKTGWFVPDSVKAMICHTN